MTTTSLATTNTTSLAVLAPTAERAREYANARRSPRTRDTYSAAWVAFVAWCETHGAAYLPASPSAVALYLTSRAEAGRTVSTIAVDLAAIVEAHRSAGHPSPREAREVRAVWEGIRRTHGLAPQRRVAPAVTSDVRAMLEALPASLVGVRDRALLALGFSGAFRRSELVALDVRHFAFSAEGLVVVVARSKVDQEGRGASVAIPFGENPSTCAARLVRAWLDASAINDGAAFRGVSRHGKLGERLDGRDVARIVKRSAVLAGLDARNYSGHSLRAGLATSAARAGRDDRAIMRQGRWSSRAMVDRYVREADLFRDNAAAGLL